MRRSSFNWGAVTIVAATALAASAVVSSTAGPAGASSQRVTTVVVGSKTIGTINENLIGVNHVVSGSTSALAAIGTRWARTDVSFEGSTSAGPDYDCTTGVWNPADLDSRVALDEEAGATPELLVDYTPSCLATDTPAGDNPNYMPPDIGPDQAKWQALVYQMAVHEITAEGVRVFEVWNEPNLGQFFLGTMQQYLNLYKDTAEALEEAATATGVSIEVGGPALGEIAAVDTTWITALASFAVANDLPLDFVSWHLYANSPDLGPEGSSYPNGVCLTRHPPDLPCYNPSLSANDYKVQTDEVRAALAAFPTLHPALWIDEWNINAGYDPRMSGPYGASFVAAVLHKAQGAGLDRMDYYFTADDASDPEGNWGLLNSDMTPKPSYYAMEMWHEMAGSELGVDVERWDKASQVDAIASTSGGAVNVMVNNFVPYDLTGNYGTSAPTPDQRPVVLKVKGLKKGATYDVTQMLDDATHVGTTTTLGSVTSSSAVFRFTLQEEGLTLITLTPVSA